MQNFKNDNSLTGENKNAFLVGFFSGRESGFSTEYIMQELTELAEAAECFVTGSLIQNKSKIEAATYIGKGKIEEVKMAVEQLNANLVIFNVELSGSQIRNLEDLIGVDVVDRTMLILDIFASRATTNIAKMQIQLAQYKYLLPRLKGSSEELSRTGSGVGARGPGEQKLETDRRHVRRIVADLSERLKESEQQKALTRKQRQKLGVPIVALVGYTNAGKSTIMNYFVEHYSDSEEHKQVFAKDMLFATLDTYHRRIELAENKAIILVDTIGFVSSLPHHLVSAFKATLEEVLEADLLLQIIDGSNENASVQQEVTQQTLKQIGAADKPMIEVYNKADKPEFNAPEGELTLSAKQEQNIDILVDKIIANVFKDVQTVTMLVPYAAGAQLNAIINLGAVHSIEHLAEGSRIVIELKQKDIDKYGEFLES